MPEIQDLSPKFKIPIAEKELRLPYGEEDIGNRVGGLSMFSNSFRRGHGNAVFGQDSNGIWLGAADFADAPFSVDMDGKLIATSATITGMGQNFVSTLVWTATDIDTATWAAGTIKTSDGTSYSIAGGNTGNITAKTYVYLDPATSITVLQISTTVTDAAGDGKILIATVEKGVASSECIITVASNPGTTIDGSGIVTNSVTASKINVSNLAAVSAQMGTVNVGGSANGDGILNIKDASDVTKVVLNSDGITINTGKLVIKDDAETTIVDAKGLVSTASFNSVSDSRSSFLATNCTGTANWIDVSDPQASIVVSRNTKVLVMATSYANMNGVNTGYMRLYLNGASSTVGYILTNQETMTLIDLFTLSSGTHTVKIQVAGQSGDAAITQATNIVAVALGT